MFLRIVDHAAVVFLGGVDAIVVMFLVAIGKPVVVFLGAVDVAIVLLEALPLVEVDAIVINIKTS